MARRAANRSTTVPAGLVAVGVLAGVILTVIVIFGLPVVCRCFAPADAPDIMFSWAQLVSDHGATKVLLRVIVPKSASCHNLARFVDGDEQVDLIRRANTENNRFPIELCEAMLDLDDNGVQLSNGHELKWKSIAGVAPKRVAIIGDSGCEDEIDQKTGKPAQNCDDDNTWPFARVASAASSVDGQRPDLVIHVGDLRYRGSDKWKFWKQDFFEPMQPLLAAAPLIIARGNHDNCYQDKGFGWKYLLAPAVPFADCTNKGNDDADVELPYAIDLTGLRIVVLDSADSYYRCQSWGAFTQSNNRKFFQDLKNLVGRPQGSLWFVSHYPLFDIRDSKACDGPNAHSFFVLHGLIPPVLASTKIDAVLSGDIHHYEILHPHVGTQWQTMQFVAGNSGTALDGATKNRSCSEARPAAPVQCQGKLDDSRGYTPAQFDVEARLRNVFGFLAATRDQSSKSWQFQLRALRQQDRAGTVTCQVPAGPGASCVTTQIEKMN